MIFNYKKKKFPVKLEITCENKDELATVYAITLLKKHLDGLSGISEEDKIEMTYILSELGSLIIKNS